MDVIYKLAALNATGANLWEAMKGWFDVLKNIATIATPA
jgi:hypothetical protein